MIDNEPTEAVWKYWEEPDYPKHDCGGYDGVDSDPDHCVTRCALTIDWLEKKLFAEKERREKAEAYIATECVACFESERIKAERDALQKDLVEERLAHKEKRVLEAKISALEAAIKLKDEALNMTDWCNCDYDDTEHTDYCKKWSVVRKKALAAKPEGK